ncbi:MAG: hypothetical protein K6G45_12065 [Lachnospiraceae bacterium]|nr:hypothetical protein [Lachnospiraceae bacterium]
MGGYIFKTDVDIARERGLEEGREKGREEGRIREYICIRKEDGYSDRSIIDNLVERFKISVEAAREALAGFNNHIINRA